MKRLVVTALALLSAALFPARAQDCDTLRVMSYNIRFGELASMQQIGEYIAGEAPDIVALQECDWATGRSLAPHQKGVKLVNELAYWRGMFGLYGKGIDVAGG